MIGCAFNDAMFSLYNSTLDVTCKKMLLLIVFVFFLVIYCSYTAAIKKYLTD